MSSGKSNYLKNKELNYNFNGGAVHAQPASLWLRLYTTPITAGGTGATEVAAASYDPVEIECNVTNFPTVTDGSIENAVAIPVYDGVLPEDWGEVAAWGLWTAATGGNLMYWGDVDPAVEFLEGALMVIPVGAIAVSSTNEA